MKKSVFKDFQYATGSRLRPADLAGQQEFRLNAAELGAGESIAPVRNTEIINGAIAHASRLPHGGTVVIPAGVFPVYTIFLQSNVTLYLEAGAVLRAAKPEEQGDTADEQRSEHGGAPGNFAEPEVNIYAGIQDHGHSYLRNALIFGEDLENVAVMGPGLLDGSAFDTETGTYENVLSTDDPDNPDERLLSGDKGSWFGNKGIALRRCRNVILKDFSIIHGGHFSIICSGVMNMYVDGILCDTDRDAFDIDGCQDVTVLNSTFNSLCDDGLCLKSDYGAGEYYPVHNVYIENCLVCGFDPGSVYDGTWTRNRVIAPDRCGPTGRVKFGTESSCGYDTVIIRKVHFLRSRGFCMEAVDTSPMHDVLMEDCLMEDISSAPIFIRVGDRARFAVTGIHHDAKMHHEEDVRLDSTQWIVPQSAAGKSSESSCPAVFQTFPAARYTPSYRRDIGMELDPGAPFMTVNPGSPARVNPANYVSRDGRYYGLRWDGAQETYVPDDAEEIPEKDLPLYANAVGRKEYASAWNIEIRNVTIRDVDPRYPIVIHGLEQSRIRNLSIHDISVEFRGGMTKRMAVEQRQLNTVWDFQAWKSPVRHQILPWQVNTFFCQNEALLPRIRWDHEEQEWVDDPYNVPEMPEVYPESSNWGILPAYGIYARHVENLTLENIRILTDVPDERDTVVLEDGQHVSIRGIQVQNGNGTQSTAGNLVLVETPFGRSTGREYLPGTGYTWVRNPDVTTDGSLQEEIVRLSAPAPGTPPDADYSWPTMPSAEHPYTYAKPISQVRIPRTVYRPYAEVSVELAGNDGGVPASGNADGSSADRPGSAAAEHLRIHVLVHDPASDQGQAQGALADACLPGKNPAVAAQPAEIAACLYAAVGGRRVRVYSTKEREFTAVFPLESGTRAEDVQIECVIDDGIRKEIFRQASEEEEYGRQEDMVGNRRFVHISE